MGSTMIYIDRDATRFAAEVRDHEAHTSASGHEYTANTLAHVGLGDDGLVMSVEQLERLHEAVGTALAKYHQSAAPAA